MMLGSVGPRRIAALGSALSLALALGVAGGTSAFAGSGPGGSVFASPACNDDSNDVGILGGPASFVPNSPVTAGIELGILGNQGSPPFNVGHVAICYSFSPYLYQGSEISGGAITVDALDPTGWWSNPNNHTVQVSCTPDANPQTVGLICIPIGADIFGVTNLVGVGVPHFTSSGPVCTVLGCPAFHLHLGGGTVGDVFAGTTVVPITIPFLCVVSFNEAC